MKLKQLQKGVYIINSEAFDFTIKKIIVFNALGDVVISILNPKKKEKIDISDLKGSVFYLSAIYGDHSIERIQLYK